MAEFTGMLGQFGLPTNTPEEELALRGRVNVAQATQGIAANDISPASMGTRIGAALGARMFNKLPQTSKDKYAVVEDTNKYIQNFKSEYPEKWASMSAEQRTLLFQRKLAENANKVGLTDVGMAVLSKYNDQRQAIRKRELELERLGVSNQRDKVGYESDLIKLGALRDAAETGQLADTIYEKGSSIPLSGRVLPRAEAEAMGVPYGSVDVGDKIIPLGEWSAGRPYQERLGRGGRPLTPGDFGVPDSEAKELRKGVRVMVKQIDAANAMRDILVEASKTSETDSIDIMGAAGTLTATGVKIMDSVAALARAAGKAAGIGPGTAVAVQDDTGKTVGVLTQSEASARAYLKSNQESAKMLDAYVPSDLRENSRLAEQWKANVVRLAYARALAREPAARQLSDQDFQRALGEVAADVSDPEAFRRVLLEGIQQDLEDIEMSLAVLPDTVARETIIGADGMRLFNESRARFDELFNSGDWGTALKPQPGLLNPTGAALPAVEEVAPENIPSGVLINGIPAEEYFKTQGAQ